MLDERCKRVVVVSAHPMAADVAAGGFMVQASRLGLEVHLVVMSRGETGVPGLSAEIVAARREKEQMEASRVLGVSSVTFLGFRCNRIYDNHETRSALTRVFRKLQADVVLTHTELDTHPDHRETAYASFAAAKWSSLPAIDVGGKPYLVKRVFTYGLPGYNQDFIPEIYLDVTPEINLKKKALTCYRTTYESLGLTRDEWLERWLAQDVIFGAQSGVKYAEGFRTYYSSHIGFRAYRLKI